MKMRQPHIAPLSRQALTALRELYPITGPEGYLFPSPRSNQRPMSDNTVLAAMRRLGITKTEMCGQAPCAPYAPAADNVMPRIVVGIASSQ